MIYTYRDLIAEFPIQHDETIHDYAHRIPQSILDKYEIKCDRSSVRESIRRELKRKQPTQTIEPKQVSHHSFEFLKDDKYNPYNFLEPINDEVEYFKLPYYSKIGFLTDIHLPFYDKLALITAIDYMKKYEPTCIWLNGDILDAYAISRWMKEKNKENLQYEIDCVRDFLKTIRGLFPKADIYYKIGNHEDRWEAFMNNNAKVFQGIDDFEFESVFRLTNYGVKLVKSKTITQSGKLNIIHGHEVFGSGGVNPSRSLFLKTFKSTICGHYHRTSEYISKALDNDIIGCFTVGSLSQQRPMYAPVNQYNLGFATVDMESNGNYVVSNKKIIDGKIY